MSPNFLQSALVRFLLLLVTLLLAPPSMGAETAATPDAIARGLAGLAPIEGMAGFSGRGYAAYASRVDQSWATYQGRIATPMTRWAAQELPPTTDRTVFYPFSGPDFPTPFFLLPDTTRYILIANQRAGQPLASTALTPAEANRLFQKYQAAWQKFGVIGFFLTNDLMRDTRPTGKEINPTGILMAFAARLGFTVESVQPVSLSTAGEVVEEKALPEANWSSVRITLRRKDSPQKIILDYVYMDLSDTGLGKHPENLEFVRKSARHPVLFKAASHLPQSPEFALIRQAVVEGSNFIVQDETGIDYGLLSQAHRVQLYGNFTRQHNLFPGSPQSALAKAYKEDEAVRHLDFRVGYEKASGSALMVALRGNVRAASAPQAVDRQEQEILKGLENYRKRERLVFVALEDRDTPYRDYLGQLREALAPTLRKLQSLLPPGKNVVLALRPAVDGKLQGIRVERSSGHADTDRKILAGIPRQLALPAMTPQLQARGEQLEVFFLLARE